LLNIVHLSSHLVILFFNVADLGLEVADIVFYVLVLFSFSILSFYLIFSLLFIQINKFVLNEVLDGPHKALPLLVCITTAAGRGDYESFKWLAEPESLEEEHAF